MAIEFANPSGHMIVLTGPNKEIEQFNKYEHKVLPDYFKRYAPRYLRIIKTIPLLETTPLQKITPKQSLPIQKKKEPELPKQSDVVSVKVQLPEMQSVTPPPPSVQLPVPVPVPAPVSVPIPTPAPIISNSVRAQVVQVPIVTNYRIQTTVSTKLTPPAPVIPIISNTPQEGSQRKLVGRATLYNNEATHYLNNLLVKQKYLTSNDIGVGILSFNRLHCVRRLIDSIRKYTDLDKTTIFISDESTDTSVKDYLYGIKDMVVLDNKGRLGIAGNTNRLLRCLERFNHKILLNDDVEILSHGWESFYIEASKKTGIRHFCMRQPGVCGAKLTDGQITEKNGISLWKIDEKPHGAICYFDNIVFRKVGYFDERFGMYGMEHVDWSNRVSMSGVQQPGYFDVIGSDKFFRIYPEVGSGNGSILAESKRLYNSLKGDTSRIYVNPTDKSRVPEISVIVPFRGLDRNRAIDVVLRNIKSQKFPRIEIIMVEQDKETKVRTPSFDSVKSILARSDTAFNKSLAFNVGFSHATCDHVLFQDADTILHDEYVNKVWNLLNNWEGIHIGRSVVYLDDNSTESVDVGRLMTGNAEKSIAYFEGGSLACRYKTYVRIGGFNEDFIGYGCEDCEFFHRLSSVAKFLNERTEDFIHLKHGRTAGWRELHDNNCKLDNMLRSQPMQKRCDELRHRLTTKYRLRD